MALITIFVILLHVVTLQANFEDDWIDGKRFAELLNNLVNQEGLGHSHLQGIYDKNSALFTKTAINGESALNQVVEKLGARFGEAVTAVRAIKTTVENNYNSFSSNPGPYTQCCQVDDSLWEYQTHMKKKVDLEDLCYRLGRDAPTNPINPASQALLDTMKDNFAKNNQLYWQYFGTEEGVFATYPSRKNSDCGNYDPRFRPFYVETTTPKPKDIVLVIDRSASMKADGKTMDLAKEAAKTVIGTLNPNEKMGLVYFSDEAFTPLIHGKYNCMSDKLALATPENKEALQNFIDTITAEGSTKYMPALDSAFTLLNRSIPTDSSSRDRAILFLTDGKPDESPQEILTYLRSKSAMGVLMLTYGLGQLLPSSAEELLQNMTFSSHHAQREGLFKRVNDADNLRYELGSYYNAFTTGGGSDHLTITIPYVDFSGLGLVTSVCMPVNHQNKFRGVTCIDYSMADLISDISYYSPGDQSYTFVIDGTGRVLVHPLLPQPSDVVDFNWKPIFIGITTLEHSNQVAPILEKMARGEEGSQEIETEIVESNGEARRDGVTRFPVLANYFWKPVNNTNFSMAIVVPNGNQMVQYLSDVQRTSTISKRFIYHRMDLDASLNLCSHGGRVATRDGPNVKFIPEAFSDPLYYVNKAENVHDNIIRYKDYMEGKDSLQSTVKLKDGVRSIVAQTEGVFDVWKETSSYTVNILWRYTGLEAGAFIGFPGFASDKRYDHTKRPWYRKAVANPGKIILSAPYNDAGGQGIVVTISKSLVEGRSGGHSPTDSLIGVMGMDFTLATIKVFLDEEFPVCQLSNYSCFVVDLSGYLVYHEDFNSKPSADETEYIHLIKMEPQIARVLIERGYLLRHFCDDFEDKETFHTWTLSGLPNGVIKNIHSIPSFEAESIPGSNVYLFLKTKEKNSVLDCKCPAVGRRISQCLLRSHTSCECPCRNSTDFDFCRNSFPSKQDRPAACVPDTVSVQFKSPIPDEGQMARNLTPCYVVNCTGLRIWRCKSIPLCSWCTTVGRCVIKSDCPEPTTFSLISTPSVTFTTEIRTVGSNKSLFIGGVTGGVGAGLLIIIIICVVVYKRKARDAPVDDHVLSENTPSPDKAHDRGSGFHIYHEPFSKRSTPDVPLTNMGSRNVNDVYLNPCERYELGNTNSYTAMD